MLKYGANVNMSHSSMSENGFTPLHSAAKNKQKEVAKLLINYGANVNAKDKSEKTPILYAIECKEIVEILLQHDADINARDKYGRTALHFTALSTGHGEIRGEIAALLLSKGANVNAKTKNGETTLHNASENGYTEVVEALLEYNADVNSVIESNMTTPLHLSAQKGNELISKMLLNKGANVNDMQKDQRTALHIAAQEGHEKVVEILLKYGAEYDSRDKEDRTLLHIAARYNRLQVVEILLKFGPDIDLRTKYGRTALHFACNAGCIGVVIALLKYGAYVNVMNASSYAPIMPSHVLTTMINNHIVKLITAGLCVEESRRKFTNLTNGNNKIRNFRSKCEAEIEIMRGEKIDNSNTSFHDILTKSISQLAIYARNENIVQALKSNGHKKKFPIYASMINSRFRRGIEKKELLEQGNKFFHSLSESLPELPPYCIEEILSYLNDKDLRILINV